MSKNWIDHAKSLHIGQTARYNCCGKDKDAIISRSPKGVSLYCFKCKANLFTPVDINPLELRRELKKAEEQLLLHKQVCMPPDCTTVFPDEGIVWLGLAGIRPDVAIEYGIRYSPTSRRMLIPVRDISGALIAIQSRAIYPWHSPKYLNTKGMTTGPALFLAPPTFTGDTIVLNEDALSAIRVGANHPAAGVFGTSLSMRKIDALWSMGVRHAIIWLDGDEAGRKGRKQMKKDLNLFGIRTSVIKSDLDPKKYSNKEIRAWISGAL